MDGAPRPAAGPAPPPELQPLRRRPRSAAQRRLRLRRDLAAAGGIAGPAAFVAAWVGGGLATDGYSPVHDAISRLAEVGAPTRPWMTAGMVAFGIGVPVFGLGLRRAVDGPAWLAAVGAGVGSLAVAALPLQPDRDVPAHAVAAGAAYVALALTPLLAAPHQQGRWRATSIGVGVAAAACLAATTAGPAHGFFQRAGLTVVDAWIVAMALRLRR